MSRRFGAVVPDWIRRSYLRQFGAAVVVILVVLFLTLGAVYAAEKRTQEESARSAVETNTETNVEKVSNWRRQYVSSTRIVSQSNKLATDANVGINITLGSILRSMPDEVVAVHFFNWQNGTVVGTSDNRVNTNATRFAWLDDTNMGSADVSRVTMTDAYVVGDDTRAVFTSPTQFGYRYAVGVEVSLSESFAFRDPVEGARTQILHRNATVMYGSGSASPGAAYAGPDRERLYNMTEYDPSMALLGVRGDGGNTTLTQADGTVASYAKVPDSKMAVVTSAPTSAFGVGARTKAYLGLVFLFVALSLGVVGFAIQRPVARSINRLADRTEQLEAGELDVAFETGRDDEIGTLYDRFAAMRDALAERIDAIEAAREEARAEADEARREAEAAREDAEAARQEAEAFSEHLERTADSYSETIRACADGDLTRRLDPDEESDAMAEIARAFNDTLADLEVTVARVRAFADDVADSTAAASETAGAVRETSREVSDDVEGIAADATEQDEHLTEVRREMNDLSATVEEVAATTDTVAELASETEAVASEGATAAGEATEEMETIESATAETAAEIRALDEEVARVGEVVDLIGDIADQTNTLALNASIEAARAGAEGSGFAVVADEVKALAEETREATAEIDELLTDLGERTDEAVADMESMREDVVAGVETTESALDALEDIAEQVRETNEGVQEISRATDDQAATTEEVVSLTERAADISDRTAGRADRVADRTAAQVSDLDDVAEDARRIESQVADLRNMLDSFTVDADPTDPGRADSTAVDAGPAAVDADVGPDRGAGTGPDPGADLPAADDSADPGRADPATDGGEATDGTGPATDED